MGFLSYNLAQEGAIQPRATGLKGIGKGLTLPVMRHPLLADSAIAALQQGPMGSLHLQEPSAWRRLYHIL